MTLFTVILFFTPTESRIIHTTETTRPVQTLDRRNNDLFPGWDVDTIYRYTPENPVMNAQKLDDAEDRKPALEENLWVITVCVVHQHPRRIAIIDEDVPLALPSRLKK
jgi:hypothetical protein